MSIHPTAVIDPSAEIDATVEIGAYAIVEKDVRIGADSRLYPHAYVAQGTTLGQRCQIHPFAVVGHLPQDLKFTDEPTFTTLGDDCVIREHATIHRGTAPGSTTVVGNACFIMSTGHIGHNCIVGNNVVIANSGVVSGHVEIGNRAFISGNVSVHQFVRIGEMAMIGGSAAVGQDVPPFMLVRFPQVILGPNVVGLRRAGVDAAGLRELRNCYRILYRSGKLFQKAIAEVVDSVQTDVGRRLAEFLKGKSLRGYLPYRVGIERETAEAS